MPADRTLAEGLAVELVRLYEDLQTRMAALISGRLSRGIEAQSWEMEKLTGVGALRLALQRMVDALERDLDGRVEQAIALAYARGGKAAFDELVKLGRLAPGEVAALKAGLPQLGAIQRMAFVLASTLRGTHLRVLRWDLDVYRQVIAEAMLTGTLAGIDSRRRTAQRAWERILTRGVTGFTDKSGRNWELASYVEMATRTGTAQAAVEGHLDALRDQGIDLVIVSDAPQECELCRPWEGEVLTRTGLPGRRRVEVEHAIEDRLITVEVRGSVDEAVARGLMHPNCFPAEVLVSAPSGVVAADARWYEGPLVVIHTASGDELPVTPNHPVLTPEGWVSAGALQVGQSVLRYRGDVEHASLSAPDDQQVPTRIGDVFDTLRKSGAMPAIRVPVTPEQFHGDGLGSDVDVVFADGPLRDGARQVSGNSQLLKGRVSQGALLADCPPLQVSGGTEHAAHGVMCGCDLCSALLCGHGRPLAGLGLAARDAGATLAYPPTDAGLADVESGRQLVLTLTGLVEADQVVNLVRCETASHVYNLQTGDGWYIANSLVVSNCRHSLSAYLPGVTKVPTHTADPEGDEARRRLRELERRLRRAKLKAAAVIDPAAKPALDKRVRTVQAQIRAHVDETGLIRQRHREQIGVAR